MSAAKEWGGFALLGLLELVLVGMKLAGAIAWPWFDVLAPVWAPFAVLMLVVFAAGAVLWAIVLGGSVFYLLPMYIAEALRRRRP